MTVALHTNLADTPETAPLPPPRLERVDGVARVSVKAAGDGATRLAGLHQSGAAKVRLPRVVAGAPLEAVFLNTAGGVTAGDRLRYEVVSAEGAQVVATSQAAERAYRALNGTARIEAELTVSSGARLDWIPQETILFEGSRLRRRFTVDLADDAVFLAAEMVVLGRTAMGEVLHDITFLDSWRVRRSGALVFADATRIDGDADAIMTVGATGNRAIAFATVVFVAPDTEGQLAGVRDALEPVPAEWGASAWNGVLVVRMVAASAQPLRDALITAIETLRGAGMPRVWHC
ncbi:urease accessory protein UreD [Bauldia sp.]|uniref:urease accessory protein UreD n=1 Tax=Bauldia sp. TaxID=2575872 RepID=UPI003BAC05DD